MVYLLFKGARFDFLTEQLAAYEAAIAQRSTKEFLDVVYSRYARRFPIDMPLEEEPSPEVLASVDDDAPEPENEVRTEDLSPEELARETEKIAQRQALIQKRRRQIATWFQYRHMKQHTVDPRSTDPSNPFTALLFSITGLHATDKPRQKSAVNCWSKTQTVSINKSVRQWCITHDVGRKNSMAVWNRIAKEEFSKLPRDKQHYWEQKAREDHAKEVEKWTSTKNAAISTRPEDRQRCIEGIVRLGQEFLDRLAEATGWKWSLIGGGPEPISDGRLTVISLHGGATNGEVPLNFGQKERELYLSQVLPVFSKFLKGCYTPEECRNRALTSSDAIPLEDAGLEDLGITFDLVSPPEDSTNNTPAPSSSSTSSPAPNAAPVANPSIARPPPSVVATDISPTGNTAAPGKDMEIDRQRQARTPSPLPSVPPTPLGSPLRSPTLGGRTITPPFSPTDMDDSHRPVDSPSITPVRPTTSPTDARPLPIDKFVTTPVVSASLGNNPATGDKSTSASASDQPETSNGASTNNSPIAAGADANTSHSVTRTGSRKRQGSTPSDAPLAKRGRPSSSSVPSAPTNGLLKCTWYINAMAMLKDDSLGEPWANLLQAWSTFEELSYPSDNGFLSAQLRPPTVYNWIQRARRVDFLTGIKDSKTYSDQHIAWWTGIQPEWRIADDAGDLDDNTTTHAGQP